MSSRENLNGVRVSTGIPGLDEVLRGGLPPSRTYLVRGRSGSGKTTLALHYSLAGVERQERVLYVILTETREELQEVARSHGWSMEGVHLHEVVERPDRLMREAQSTLFIPSEIELGDTVQEIIDLTRELRPTRVVIDPLSELRIMSVEPLRFRRQFLALKQVFAEVGATALLLEEVPGATLDAEHLENVAHGVILLDQETPTYGPDRRRVRIMKVRGMHYLGGFHDLDIVRGGMSVYPRPASLEKPADKTHGLLSTQLPALDRMLGGGIEEGTTTLLLGQTGAGKSSLIGHMMSALASQNLRGCIYLFEEREAFFRKRMAALSFQVEEQIASGELIIKAVEPEEMSPGQLLHEIRSLVETQGVKAIALDSLNGLFKSMYDEPYITVRLRETLAWASRQGVTAFLAMQASPTRQFGSNFSYFADSILSLGLARRGACIFKTISVIKRRGGRHEPVVRELNLSSTGIRIGRNIGVASIPGVLDPDPLPHEIWGGGGGTEEASSELSEQSNGEHW